MASEIDILVKASQEGLENITTAADKINDRSMETITPGRYLP